MSVAQPKAMTREELIERVREVIETFPLPEPRLPYSERDGVRLTVTSHGNAVREDNEGRLILNPSAILSWSVETTTRRSAG